MEEGGGGGEGSQDQKSLYGRGMNIFWKTPFMAIMVLIAWFHTVKDYVGVVNCGISNYWTTYRLYCTQKEHSEIHKIPKFAVNQASFDRDSAI